MLPKRISHGQSLKNFPADSFNSLVDGRLLDLRTPETIDDTRKPRDKSPVIVQLIWGGGSDLPSGNIVKLGASFYDPTTIAYAPFSGLKFRCSAFGTNEAIVDYAISMQPIAVGKVGYGIMPEAYWAQVAVSNTSHTFATITTAGTLLTSAGSGTLRIIWKPTGTGTKWCVLALAGSAADSYQIVRGVTTGTVLDTDANFTITSLVALEDHSLAPGDPLTVINIGAKTHASGDLVYAIKVAASTSWEELAGGASSAAPLRRFKYTASKAVSSTSATVKWLDDTNATVGGDVTVYDPENQFHGRIASYVSGEAGMLGIALLRKDLATSGAVADRWEIVASEGYAEFIYATWYATGIAHYVSNESATDPWNRRVPAAAAGQITLADPASLLPGSPTTGLKLICRLRDPDTSSPTYDLLGIKGTDGSVQFGIVTSDVAASTTLGTAGTGVVDFSAFGGSSGVTVQNYYFDDFPTDTIVSCINNKVVGAGCTLVP